MPELRQNYFTKEWVIIATERAKRPGRPDHAPSSEGRVSIRGDLSILRGQRK